MDSPRGSRAEDVNDFHTYDDVDKGWNAHHHTLGKGPNNAAAGNHTHPASPEVEPIANAHLLDATDAHDASAVSLIPTGDVVSTDVQSAIAELASEKATVGHTHAADGSKADKTIDLTAGAGLSGGGTLAANRTFDVNVDGSTLEISADTVQVKNGGITVAKLSFDPATQAELDAAVADYIARDAVIPYVECFSVQGVLTVTAYTMKYRIMRACHLLHWYIEVGTAPTGASLIVDVQKETGGVSTSVFNVTPANRPTITAGNTTAVSGTPDTTVFAAGDFYTVSVLQIGSTVAGSDLVVQPEVAA